MDRSESADEFPAVRPRRLRNSEQLRRLVRETNLSLDQFIMPYFVREGIKVKEAIDAMPGQFRFSTDLLIDEIEELLDAGIRAVLLFGLPETKDEKGSAAWAEDGVTQRAVRELKGRFPELLVITDVCLCPATTHGHCGLVNDAGQIENDSSVDLLARTALSHAHAGADMVAPSDMMDGRIAAIRRKLDENGFSQIPIMSYAAKFASAFYGPFRDAAHSEPRSFETRSGSAAPQDRKTYQMDFSNRKEAMREIELDIKEGADIVMVKPAWAYLDIIRDVHQNFPVPLAAYSVSGEYAMIKAAAQAGYMDEKQAVVELMTGLARAGARLLITYFAKDIALWHKSSQLQSFQSLTITP